MADQTDTGESATLGTLVHDNISNFSDFENETSTKSMTTSTSKKRGIAMLESDDVGGDQCIPDDVHPWLVSMLNLIKKNTECTNEKVNDLDNRVLILEDNADHIESEIEKLRTKMDDVLDSNKSILGRLIRAENVIDRQRLEISDLRSRSMRDNIIIKTSGPEYKEVNNENTAATVVKFLAKEMRIPNADKIMITRAHRMGQAGNGYNKPMIAKLAYDDDIRKIFANAKVLKNTNYSISTQVPQEINERRQFGWGEFKAARDDRKLAKFDGGRLVISGEPVCKYDRMTLPPEANASLGQLNTEHLTGMSDVITAHNHHFRACVTKIHSLQDIRDSMDIFLRKDEFINADYIPYAFRYIDQEGKLVENFHSDDDSGTGLQILKALRKKDAMDIVVFVTHYKADNYIGAKSKMETIIQLVSGALLSLGNANMDTTS